MHTKMHFNFWLTCVSDCFQVTKNWILFLLEEWSIFKKTFLALNYTRLKAILKIHIKYFKVYVLQ